MDISKLEAFLEGEVNKLSLVNFGLDEVKKLRSLEAHRKEVQKQIDSSKMELEKEKASVLVAVAEKVNAEKQAERTIANAREGASNIVKEAEEAVEKIRIAASEELGALHTKVEKAKDELAALNAMADNVRAEHDKLAAALEEMKAKLRVFS